MTHPHAVAPCADNILVRLIAPPTQTRSGLHLPPPGKRQLTDVVSGTIIAAGPGRYHPDSGVLMPTQVAPGQRVVMLATAGQVAQDWGMDLRAERGNAGADFDEFRIVREDELMAVLG